MEDRAFVADELAKLAALRDSGVLSSEEFDSQKALLLEGAVSEAAPDLLLRPPPATQAAMIPSMATTSTTPAGAWFSILGGAIAVVSGFLPWVMATTGLGGGFTRNAFQFGAHESFSVDGVVLMVLGTIAVIIGIVRLTNSAMPRFLQRSPIVLGIVVALVPLNRLPAINSSVHNIQNACSGACTASIGYGVYTAFVGALLMLIGGFVLRARSSHE